MPRKRDNRAKGAKAPPPKIGFSNGKFLELIASLTGVQPVGELGRETPLDLTSLEAARGSLLIRELFSKYDDGKPSETKELVTWERFHEAERVCEQTNETFYNAVNRDPFWVSVRRRIWTLLGKFDWDEAAKHFGHGPGGTTRLTRKHAAAAYKYSGIPESTSGNAVLATCAIYQVPLWNQSALARAEEEGIIGVCRLVAGNSVITVPKNYKTNRTIGKEPCMNVYIQKGIGRCIRKRLKQVGVDLNDQGRNQQAAFKGSLLGELATMDLSMASDTLAYEVVSWLLPNDWWWALEQSRSPVGVLPSGEIVNYQKFSSMGNGYTFELESLIFWAITQQVCCPNVNERDASVCVYGDDIIVPSIHFETLAEKLRVAGFTPNVKKSFATGPFRESCGMQYYSGSDVTPFYIRKRVATLDRLFLVHNNLKRWGARTGVDVAAICAGLRSLAPAKWRDPRLPDGFGDGAFIGAVDELRLDSHPYGWEFWQVSALAQTSIELEGDLPDGQLIASLMMQSTRKPLLTAIPNLIGAERRLRALNGNPPVVSSEQMLIDEALCGLPVREGRYREIKILIPQYPAPL